MCTHRETWLIPYSWQFNFSLCFQELRLVGITWAFPVVVLKWGNGVMGDIQHSIEGTLAQGSYLLSRLGNTWFPCSLTAVDMVWTQLAITSLSRPVIHVHSESGSRLYCSGLFSHPPPCPHALPVPACLDILPFPSYCLFLLFFLLSLSTLISWQTFLLLPPSNHSYLILWGLYSIPTTSR